MKKKTVYIAIEIKVREFISQIFLISKLIKKDYRVYLGNKDQIFNLIQSKKNKGGIFFYKAGIPPKYVQLVNNKTDVHAVIDQELMPGISDKQEYRQIVNCFTKEGVKFIDIYFAVNKMIFKLAKEELKNIRGKVYFTGSPRIDLWKKKYHYLYKDEVKKIKKKYGNFYLFNSDLQYITENIYEEALEFMKPKDLNVWSGSKFKNTIPKRLKMAKKLNHEFKEIVPFIKELQKKINTKIIIRPHPAENRFTWSKLFLNYKNIIIEDPVNDVFPWIIAAKGLFHRGCTTSLQSLYIKKPTFFLDMGKKFKENYIFKNTSYRLSKRIFKDKLKDLKLKYRDKTVKNSLFKNELGVEREEAVDKIVNIFDKYQINKEEKHKSNINNNFFDSRFLVIKKIIYYVYSKFYLKKKPLGRFKKIYNGITAKEVRYYMNKMNKKNSFIIKQHLSDTVVIEKK